MVPCFSRPRNTHKPGKTRCQVSLLPRDDPCQEGNTEETPQDPEGWAVLGELVAPLTLMLRHPGDTEDHECLASQMETMR